MSLKVVQRDGINDNERTTVMREVSQVSSEDIQKLPLALWVQLRAIVRGWKAHAEVGEGKEWSYVF